MHFRIVIVKPPGWDHAGIFAELAETLYHAFFARWAARPRSATASICRRQNIVMAAFNLTPESLPQLPAKTIVYNLEQVEDAFFEKMPVLRQAFCRFEVWDYSVRNIERLRDIAPKLFHLPIGTMPQMTRIASAVDQDIDVLFNGVMTDRRARVLQRIAATGLRIKAVFGVYGTDRDALIGRSKVVLNVHQHDAHVFEIARISYLLANRKGSRQRKRGGHGPPARPAVRCLRGEL